MPKMNLQPSSLTVPSSPFVPGTKKGSLVYTSGQVSIDANGKLVGKDDIKAQTLQVLRNVQAVIEEGGGKLADVMKTTVFLADIKDFPLMNEIYAEFFGGLNPARSTIQAPLASPEYLVEIEAVAVVGD